MELREQFTLASGVSQSMTPFKSKPRGREESPTSSVSGDTRNGQGPITKVSSVDISYSYSYSLVSLRYVHCVVKLKGLFINSVT